MNAAVKSDRLARWMGMCSSEAGVGTLDELCQRVSEGVGLLKVSEAWDVPYGRVLMWLMGDVGRWSLYRKALEAGAYFEVEEAKEIADGSGDAKERVAIRKWRAVKHAKEMYGEESRVVVSDPFGELLQRVSERKLAALRVLQDAPLEIDVTPKVTE